MSNKETSNTASRSWFCVWNNPQKIYGDIEPRKMVEQAIETWCKDKPQRVCAINYENGENGTPHMHMILEDTAKTRFSYVQKLYDGIHIEVTKGTKAQAESYILKKEPFEEKNHTVVIPAIFHGNIKANQGKRNDLDVIQELIEQGKTPNEIMDLSIHYCKEDTLIKKRYFRYRYKNSEKIRNVIVYWHVGESGTGKSYTYTSLCKKNTDNVYLMTDYENGGLDNYMGEKILFMDEFKGNLKFQVLLNYLDKYIGQYHSRYCNGYMFWDEVHITSVFPPEEAYKTMVESDNRARDRITQLLRRITYMVYHYKENEEYKRYQIPAEKYESFELFKQEALSNSNGFVEVSRIPSQDIPFIM